MPTIDTAGDGTVRRFAGRIDTLQSRSLLPHIVTIVGLVIVVLIALSGLPRSFAAEQPSDVPAWLRAHVGEGEGQIAPVVLQRARALYLQKVSEGAVKNPCYFAMDATRPGGFGRRFYVICEADQTFRAVPSGHGSGRNVAGCEFRQRNSVREELQQCDGFQADDRRALCDGRDDHVVQRLLPQRSGKIRGVQPLVRAVRRRRRHGKRADRAPSAGIRPRCCGWPVCEKIRTAPTRTRTATFRSERWWITPAGRSNGCTSLVAVGRRANHPDDEGQADGALHLS